MWRLSSPSCFTLFKGFGKEKGWRFAKGAGKRAGIALIAAAVVLPAIVVTPPGHRAAIYTLTSGVSDVERGEGLSFVFPYAQTARMVNVRTQVYRNAEVFAQSLDLQEITAHVALNYHVDPDEAAELYQSIGLGYEATIIAPAVLQLAKQEIGLVKAVDFARNREPLARDVEAALVVQLAPYGIIVEYFNIEDAVFDQAFILAVKNKVIADEEAAREQRLIAAEAAKKEQTILKAEAEGQKRLIEARGEREAIVKIAAALGFTADEYLEWLLIGAWSGDLPTTLIGDAGDFGVLLTP
ncbi:hypothetical protein LCGC14_2843560 [marine sediment metagenome]|uniref:Band 7 domain-containing protein n=1 Tax=marine sediment metagenome TaxID=412755 RepID=A0A0F9AJ15_9ZZZZ